MSDDKPHILEAKPDTKEGSVLRFPVDRNAWNLVAKHPMGTVEMRLTSTEGYIDTEEGRKRVLKLTIDKVASFRLVDHTPLGESSLELTLYRKDPV